MRRPRRQTVVGAVLPLAGLAAGAFSVHLLLAGWRALAGSEAASPPAGLEAAKAGPAPGADRAAASPPAYGLEGPAADPVLERLLIPVAGIGPGDLGDSFHDPRSGRRRHHAIDIPAPRNTPVLAAADGTIRRLGHTRLGGNSIYQLGPRDRHAFFYAHLEGYAPGLAAGDRVRRGQLLGYVGTSGNAPADSPHLHFAVYRLEDGADSGRRRPANPYPLLVR